MKTRFNGLALVASITVPLAYLGSSSCFGQGTIYRDRIEFDAAIAALPGIRHDLDFQGPLLPGDYSPPLTIAGLTFHSGSVLQIRRQTSGNYFLVNYDSLAPLAVDMNGPTMAFGADFASLLTPFYSSFLATVTLDNGNVFTFTAPADPNFTFFGFVTTQPFSRLTFSDGGIAGTPPPLHEEILDNITVVRVPEPSGFAVLALGGLFLIWCWTVRLGRSGRTTLPRPIPSPSTSGPAEIRWLGTRIVCFTESQASPRYPCPTVSKERKVGLLL
jgi:hypothetical protein